MQEYGRRPTKILLKWRLQGGNWKEGHSNWRASASCSMPPSVSPPFSGPMQAAAIEKAAMTLLTRSTTPSFNLTLLNLGDMSPTSPCAHSHPVQWDGFGSHPRVSRL